MPELPEVETVVRDLRPLLAGRRLAAPRAGDRPLRRPWKAEWGAAVAGARVAGVRRRGKWIVVELDAPHRLVAHLGMTGQLTVEPAVRPEQTHTHLAFPLDTPDELRFRDIRRFGSVELFAGDADVEAFLAGRLGPEPDALSAAQLHAALGRTARPVKAALLDQLVVAGVGNIYADEALFRAKLHPLRTASGLTAREAARLRDAVAGVIAEAIAGRGSTIRNYVGGSGLAGGFQDRHAVYGRGGEPCPACGVPVEVLRVAGRSSHFCPNCQPSNPRGKR